MNIWKQTFVALLYLASFSIVGSCQTYQIQKVTDKSKLGPTFTFRVADSQTRRPIPGVEVTLVVRRGTNRVLGKTNSSGILVVSFSELELPDAELLVFCHPQFFCGALWMKKDEVLDYREMLIHLAPFAVQ